MPNASILIMMQSKIDDVLTEHGGLLHVLPLAVHLKGTPHSCLKVMGWGGVGVP